jgi:hypothetical protein
MTPMGTNVLARAALVAGAALSLALAGATAAGAVDDPPICVPANPGNTGTGNTGAGNTGDHNDGSGNTGDHNTGYGNTGDNNTGYGNTVDGNTGSGDSPTGYPTQYGNSGYDVGPDDFTTCP